MDDAQLTKAKANRSRAACDPCRLVKQKCDGPSMVPCRRCQLYSLACSYSMSASAGVKKSAKLVAATTPTLPLQQSPTTLDQGTNNLLHDMAARLRSIESAISSFQLANLSSGSSASTHHGSASHHPSQSPPEGASPQTGGAADDAVQADGDGAPRVRNAGETAVQAISDAADLLSQVAATLPHLAAPQSPAVSEGRRGAGGLGRVAHEYDEGIIERVLQTEGWVRPDALDRGVMTSEECDKTFEIFFSRLAPWTPFFPAFDDNAHSLPEAYTPLAVRKRSPLLFHTILLATAYFLLPSPGERSKRVYLGLTGIVNELVAPIVISMSTADITSDTVRSLLLLVLWKPVQHAHYLLSSSSSLNASAADAERFYKNNAASSASVWLLATHLLRALNLPSAAPLAFTRAVQGAAAHGRAFDSVLVASSAAAQTAVDDLRLLCMSLVVDAHGALTTGRAAQFSPAEGASAVRTARALAGLGLQASDVRLAAFVELYELVCAGLRAPWADVALPWSAAWEGEMDAWNARIESWEAEWTDRLKAAFVGGADDGDKRDSVAWSVLGNKHLCKAVLNASVFHRWNRSRRLAPQGTSSPPVSPPLANASSAPPAFSPGGGTARTQGAIDLSPAEWRFLQVSIDAIERIVFQFSVESRVVVAGKAYDGYRQVQWPARDPETGLRKPLTVDTVIAEAMKTSHDPVSCIGIVYPLILLCKICNAGLARCELTTMNQPADLRDLASGSISPARSAPPHLVPFARPRAILQGRKLCVLLHLGAAFLEHVAPTPAHPAAVHAETLRTIVKAGTWGQDAAMATAAGQASMAEAVAAGQVPVGLGVDAGGMSEMNAGALLAAILAQMSSPAQQGTPAPAPAPDAPRSPGFAGAFSTGSDGSLPLPPLAAARDAPFFPLADNGLAGFASWAPSGPSGFDTIASPPDPARDSRSSFLTAVPGTGVGMEVDADALSGLDWTALERQLGMETGSLSAGFAGSGIETGAGFEWMGQSQ
ncbi:hypothetical protein JCM3770_006334 [Rhodotorula araucariae]